MALSASQRIDMIRESSALLGPHPFGDAHLVLEQHGLQLWRTSERDESVAEWVQDMIRNVDDEKLTALHTYLTGRASGPLPGNTPFLTNGLRLFCSHLAVHREYVGQVGAELARFYIEGFVAHDAIEPSKEWALVIESALADADAGVVFLYPGFRESVWCDQEVGWLLGRRVPMLPLYFGIHPSGFLGKLQDTPCSAMYPAVLAWLIVGWLSKVPSVHTRLGTSLVNAFVHSPSWDHTRRVSESLDRIESISNEELDLMEQAAVSNINVRECNIFGTTGPEWVRAFARKRRGVQLSMWDDQPPF